MNGHDPRYDYDDEPWKGRRGPEAAVKNPADLMWSLGLFQMGASLLTALVAVSAAVDHVEKGLAMRPEQVATAAGLVALSVIGTVIGGVVVRGAVALRRLQNHSRVRLAAVLTLLSIPFFAATPFSTPVGIWVLFVLRRSDVRARFKAVADEANQSRARSEAE
jgi:hypothetical protein